MTIPIRKQLPAFCAAMAVLAIFLAIPLGAQESSANKSGPSAGLPSTPLRAGPSAELPSTPLRTGPSAGLSAGKHLFILSGQSNMAHIDPDESFTPAVEKAFGKDNVTVAKSAEGGAAIRYWDKDYQWPADRPEKKGRDRKESEPKKDKKAKEFGWLYDSLMVAVKKKTAGNPPYETVTLIWMQGETDAGEDLADLYIDSFQRVLARLKSELKIESINVVVGRLSDWGLGIPKIKAANEQMREIQVKFAEDNPSNVEWVNTDDLNDDEKKGNLLHYHEAGLKILGERFADKAIGLIQKKKAAK